MLLPLSLVRKYLRKFRRHDKKACWTTADSLVTEQKSERPLYQFSKSRLADHSTDAQTAYQYIHDELEIESKPNMNMASYGKPQTANVASNPHISKSH